MGNHLYLTLRSVVVALQFLTRLPIPIQVPFDREHVARSVVFFPFCGAVIGLLTGLSLYALQQVLPPLPAAALALVCWNALIGGLHLDGWMDTADGVLSHRSRERMLEIMKDSRVGAMGVIAGVMLLLVKFSALASLLAAGSGWLLVFACIPVWSRWWMAASIAIWPYARQSEGMGSLFAGVRGRHAASSAVVGLLIMAALFLLTSKSEADLLLFAMLPLGAALLGLLLGFWLYRKLGGQTGDTYGAMNEWIEAGLLLALTAAIA